MVFACLLAYTCRLAGSKAKINRGLTIPAGPERHVHVPAIYSYMPFKNPHSVLFPVGHMTVVLSLIHVSSLSHIRVCVKAGVCAHGSPDSFLCSENVVEVYGALFSSMNDYTTGSRGDVGSL